MFRCVHIHTCYMTCVYVVCNVHLYHVHLYTVLSCSDIVSPLKYVLLFYLFPSLYNTVCHGILSSFPHCITNFSVANSEFAFTLRHFICPALRGIINHILLLGYLRMFIYVQCFFGKMHYEEGTES